MAQDTFPDVPDHYLYLYRLELNGYAVELPRVGLAFHAPIRKGRLSATVFTGESLRISRRYLPDAPIQTEALARWSVARGAGSGVVCFKSLDGTVTLNKVVPWREDRAWMREQFDLFFKEMSELEGGLGAKWKKLSPFEVVRAPLDSGTDVSHLESSDLELLARNWGWRSIEGAEELVFEIEAKYRVHVRLRGLLGTHQVLEIWSRKGQDPTVIPVVDGLTIGKLRRLIEEIVSPRR